MSLSEFWEIFNYLYNKTEPVVGKVCACFIILLVFIICFLLFLKYKDPLLSWIKMKLGVAIEPVTIIILKSASIIESTCRKFTVNGVAKLAQIDPEVVKENIKDCQKKGYVKWVPPLNGIDEPDERKYQLTDKGENILKNKDKYYKKVNKETSSRKKLIKKFSTDYEKLTEEQQDTVVALNENLAIKDPSKPQELVCKNRHGEDLSIANLKEDKAVQKTLNSLSELNTPPSTYEAQKEYYNMLIASPAMQDYIYTMEKMKTFIEAQSKIIEQLDPVFRNNKVFEDAAKFWGNFKVQGWATEIAKQNKNLDILINPISPEKKSRNTPTTTPAEEPDVSKSSTTPPANETPQEGADEP